LAGGLTVHNLRERRHFAEERASENVRAFDRAIPVAAAHPEVRRLCIARSRVSITVAFR